MLFSPPDKEISTIYCMVNYLMPSQAYLTSHTGSKKLRLGEKLVA